MTQSIEDLVKENEELKRQNAVKSDLISISAHQLRTSLSAMKWGLKMFVDGDFGTTNPEQKNFLSKALDSNNRMIAFVNEMLSINHAEDTLEELKLSDVDLIKLIDELVFDFSGEAFKKNLQLVFLKQEGETFILQADQEKIRVVVQNLIENAIKYSNDAGRVVINLSKKDGIIEISVRDSGIGITKEEQTKIFEKFFRANNARKQDSVGSGLGLYTTRCMIEKHHGKIWFESEEGVGTTFHVEIPEKVPS